MAKDTELTQAKTGFWRQEKVWLIGLALLSFFLFFWQLGRIPLWDGDSLYWGMLAKKMLASGNFLTLPVVTERPPLFIWLWAISIKIFGPTTFALAGLHSLIAAGTVLLTYHLARRLFNPATAILSSLILLTSAQFFYQARCPLMDIPLTFLMLLVLDLFLIFWEKGNYWFFYGAATVMGLAALTKGVVAIVLGALFVLVFITWTGQWKRPGLRLHLVLGFFLSLTLILPWFIIEYLDKGRPFLDEFLRSNFTRFFHPVEYSAPEKPTKPQLDFYMYIVYLFFSFLPWSGFLIPLTYASIKKATAERKGKKYQLIFLLSWTLMILAFFSLSGHLKIIRYILPLFPTLSILAAWYILEIKKTRLAGWLTLFLSLPLVGAAVLLLKDFFPKETAIYLPMVKPFLIFFLPIVVLGALLLIRQKRQAAVILLIAGAITAYFLLLASAARYLPRFIPYEDLAKTLDQKIPPGSRVVSWHSRLDYAFYGNFNAEILDWTGGDSDPAKGLAGFNDVYLITEDEKLPPLGQNRRITSVWRFDYSPEVPSDAKGVSIWRLEASAGQIVN